MAEPHPARRTLVALSLAALVVTGVAASSSAVAREGGVPDVAPVRDARPTVERAADGHGHDHSDPATKNALSRSGETGVDTADPTSAAEKATQAAAAAAGRRTPEPPLTTAPLREPRTTHPATRYDMAGRCSSRPPTSAATCSTTPAGASSAPRAPRPTSRATTRSGGPPGRASAPS